ncbi:MAG: type I pullulanase [Bacteroidota bacterium]
MSLLMIMDPSNLAAQPQTKRVVVHYYRYGHDYSDWNLWGWVPGREGQAYPFLEEDDFGRRLELPFPLDSERFGLLLRKGDWEAKDVTRDRYLPSDASEVWLIEGDDKVYFDKQQADRRSKITGAFLDAPDQLTVHLTNDFLLVGEGGQGFALYGEDTKPIPIRSVVPLDGQETPCHAAHLRITLVQPLEPHKRYFLTHPSYRSLDVVKRDVLNDSRFSYTGDDLGARYTPQSTSFRVWAPSAQAVSVALYEMEVPRLLPMHRDSNGIWWAIAKEDLKNVRYTYRVTLDGQERESVDPYARGLTRNGKYGLVVDLKGTDPEGWDADQRPPLGKPTDAILYEMHVRDFSVSPDSGIEKKGKFLAFTEGGTKTPDNQKTGLDHLRELGITHVHLMPSMDFATVDEGGIGYNWGYDPYHYFAPEGSYATNPDDDSRIREFKAMVQALHSQGIRVVMDVVFNHTYSVDSALERTVPSYYYRFNAEGKHSNGSGCGNELASERPMVRKLIVDSLKYWATEYHVDGFRFDLMALHDRETMKQAAEALHRIDPSILLYGEPWCGGESALGHDRQLVKGAQRGLGVAVFNDHFRNAIKGDPDGWERAFATGEGGKETLIRHGIRGAIDEFADHPCETVNYVSCHDNLTLWDKINKSNSQDSEEERIKMDLLSHALVLLSQGIPFLHGGEEFLRTKGGNHNSYNAGDAVNQIDWSRKGKYRFVFDYVKGLIRLRREHPAFRMSTADQLHKHLTFLPSPKGTVAFLISHHANGDRWDSILVAFNQTRQAQPLIMPDPGRWVTVVNDREAGTNPVQHQPFVQGETHIPAMGTLVMFR